MPVVYRTTSPNAGVGFDATAAISASVLTGDIQIAFILSTVSTNTVSTVPTGWTLIRTNSPTGFKTWAYWKVRAGGDSTAPIWVMSANSGWAVDVWAASGQAATNPINVENGNVAAALLAVSVSVTPTVADCYLVMGGGADTGTAGQGRTWTQTSPMVERVDSPSDVFYRFLADQLLSGGSGAAQSRTATITGAATNLSAHLIAVAPEPVVTTNTANFFPFFF